MQQGGIGLLLTTVIITMPTVAAELWQGSMGSFMAFSAFDRAGSSPGPQGQAPGSYMPQQANRDESVSRAESAQTLGGQRTPSISQSPSNPEGSGSRGIANQGGSSRFTGA